MAVATDSQGNVIMVGSTVSPLLPGTANAFQPTHAVGFPNNADVFIAKFDPSGQKLLWTTFFGGDGDDIPTGVAADSTGNIHVIGTTRSSNLPVTSGAYVRSSSPGGNGFAARISADGHSLRYSTYLPGTPNALAVNNAGDAYMVGLFLSTVITPGALGTGADHFTAESNGVFLLRLNSTGTGLVFGAYLGGGGFNGSIATSVALSSQGNAYVAGFTAETNIPTTANAFQRQYSNPGTGIPCCSNGFIAEVNSSGSQLLYGTYFGPQFFGTSIHSLVVALDGSLYLSGSTNSTNQATAGAYLSSPGEPYSGFLAKLTPGRPTLDAFSYIPSAAGPAIEANLARVPVLLNIGNQPETVYVTSATNSHGFTNPPGFTVLELSTPSLALISSFSSPSQGFAPLGSALATPHSLWLVGSFGSQGCPACSLDNLISSNAFQSVPSGTGDAVLIQFTDIAPTISIIGSSATGTSPFAAGQLISIYGTQLGPAASSGAQIGPDGAVTKSNAGTQVFFDGMAAPILYAGASQVNTAVPCSVTGRSSTQVVVTYQGAQSAPFTLPLSVAAPGIFTADGSGRGQAAVLNQDYSLNGPSNPATRGSAVTFYATGIGATSPCVDGQTYQSNFPNVTLPVIAGVGGVGAQILYAGQAPYFISGVAQINTTIPSDAPTGSVPLTLLVGGVSSPPGVTVAVK